jgi:hypothetical protein
MALNNQPYLKFFVQDWLSNTKLKMCSMAAHGLMVNIMSIAHREQDYGYILLKQNFKQKDNTCLGFAQMLARLLPFESLEIFHALQELVGESVLHIEGEKLICHRMVRDYKLSLTRSESGREGGISSTKNKKEFAQAKTEAKGRANTEYEHEYVNELVIENEVKGVQGENEKPTTPESLKFIVHSHWPTLQDCEEHFTAKGSTTAEAAKFFNFYTAQGWVTSGGAPIVNWRFKADERISNPKRFEKEVPKETGNGKIIDSNKYLSQDHGSRKQTA